MTQEELMRFKRGNELSEQIEALKKQIDDIEYRFDKNYYPRTESSWRLSAIINDSIKGVNLSLEEFWECVETIHINQIKIKFEKK